MKNFTIITDEMITDYNINIRDLLDDEVDTHLKGLKIDTEALLEESLIGCESPIEQLLSLHLNYLQMSLNDWNPFIEMSGISNNQKIKCKNGKTYRLDFYFVVLYKNQETKYYGIECDGYEFHQKTKEQVEYDNQRQRDLQNEGIEIIRFSGSEIWKSPLKCAKEVQKIILSNCKYIME
jgi:very-short-patch-repair endonuclease